MSAALSAVCLHSIGWARRGFGVLGVCLLLTGCPEPLPTSFDYQESRYELSTVARPRQVIVSGLGTDGSLAPQGRREAALLFDTFRERARGPLIMAVYGLTPTQSRQLGDEIQTLARRRGVNPIRLELVTLPAATPALSFTFRDYEVTQPVCGFERNTMFDPYHRLTPRAGCAVNRSIGAMIARPADLHQPPESSSRDSERVDTLMKQYEAGEPTGAGSETVAEQAETTG